MFFILIINNLIQTSTMGCSDTNKASTINDGLCPCCNSTSVTGCGRTPRAPGKDGVLMQHNCCIKCGFTFYKYALYDNGDYGPKIWWFDDVEENHELIEMHAPHLLQK
jgi:hypothetical protein